MTDNLETMFVFRIELPGNLSNTFVTQGRQIYPLSILEGICNIHHCLSGMDVSAWISRRAKGTVNDSVCCSTHSARRVLKNSVCCYTHSARRVLKKSVSYENFPHLSIYLSNALNIVTANAEHHYKSL